MMVLAEIALFFKTYWIPVLAIAIIAGLGLRYETVRIERDSYKVKLATATETIKQAETQLIALRLEVTQANAKTATVEREAADNAAQLTSKYKNVLAAKDVVISKNEALNEQNIKQSKELRNLHLSLNAVRLFNASKQQAESGGVPASGANSAATVKGNDATTGTAGTVTVSDAFQVVAHNDANHLRCIAKVQQWQSFWKDFSTKYVALGTSG